MKNLNWLVRSSSDPQQLSMTVKAALLALAPVAVWYFGVTDGDFNQVVESIGLVVFYGGSLVSAGMAAWGLLRKVLNGRWAAPVWGE